MTAGTRPICNIHNKCLSLKQFVKAIYFISTLLRLKIIIINYTTLELLLFTLYCWPPRFRKWTKCISDKKEQKNLGIFSLSVDLFIILNSTQVNSTQLYCDIFAAQRAELRNTQNSTTRSAINFEWNNEQYTAPPWPPRGALPLLQTL